MSKKCFVVVAMVFFQYVCGVSFAEDVVVPNVFSPHTTAESSEVNENFQTLADAINNISGGGGVPHFVCDGSTYGKVLRIDGRYMYIITEKGYFTIVIRDFESNGGKFVVYSDTSDTFGFTGGGCSGTAYLMTSRVAHSKIVMGGAGAGTVYYVKDSLVSFSKSSVVKYDFFDKQFLCTSSAATEKGIQAYPNDVTITGVPNDGVFGSICNIVYK